MAGPPVLRFQRGLPHSKQFGERLRLLVIQGEDKGVCFSLLGDLVFLGREGTQILLKDNNMSRKHAEISWRGDHYVIRDLGSSNGILVNGTKVTEARLSAGNILLIGLTVLEVYAAGQVRAREAPQIEGYVSPLKVKKTAEGEAALERSEAQNTQQRKERREVDKKKMVVYVFILMVGFAAFFNSDEKEKTLREKALLDMVDDDTAPKKKLTQKELEAAVKEYIPNYSLETPQKKDAEIFFRTGVREKENKNYRRAINAFETALTVDPSHELSKIYLKSTKKEMEGDIKATSDAALRAMKSIRFKEAKMHYENIIRYLETDKNNKLYVEASEALKVIEKEENKK